MEEEEEEEEGYSSEYATEEEEGLLEELQETKLQVQVCVLTCALCVACMSVLRACQYT